MQDKQPNVLWIFADQLRPQTLGCYGNNDIHTPNINRLAAESLQCNRSYANYALCCPFRASLLTGCHPWQTGVIGHAYRLREDIRTVADAFNDSGYHTSYIGKWHLNGQPAGNRAVPGRRGGYRHFKGFELSNKFFATKIFDEQNKQMDLPAGFQTDILTDITVNEINNLTESAQPFFLTLSVEPPHLPYIAPDEYMRRFADKPLAIRDNVPEDWRDYCMKSLRGYYAQVENIDYNIGRIIETLERLNVLDDTIVMFFSDHGDMLGSHGKCFKQWPYEESVRIPLLVRYPQKIGKGIKSNMPLSNLDIFPTTAALAGLNEDVSSLAGHNLAEHFQNPEKDDLINGVLITDISPTPWGDTYCQHPWRSYISGNHKITFKHLEFWQLFDLDKDPFEMNNLIDNPDYADIKHQLTMEFIKELEQSGDGFQVPRNYLKYINI